MTVAATPYGRGLLDGLRPPPRLTVSQWADRHRKLSSRSSAESGQYRTDRTPYVREIADALSPSSTAEIVVWMKGAQIGATEVGNNWIGYVIHHEPGPTMMVLPTVETAKRNSKLRIAPMIEESPALRERVADARARDSSNTILQKDFPGGSLLITGANSAVGLRSVPIRNLMLDEVDGYPHDVDGEGDPVELALKRTVTFGRRRKVFILSTPTIGGASRIETAFLRSDQRYYEIPCPHCGEYQVLTWGQIKWPSGKPRAAEMECVGCERMIGEAKKTWMLERGIWRATAEGDGGRTVGFHLSALYSPIGWYSWGEAAEKFVQAKDEGREAYREFVNLDLGEPFIEEGTSLEHEKIMERCEVYAAPCPAGVLVLTAGVDVQHNRVELEVVGWGRGNESWSIEKRVFLGDPQYDDVWVALDAALEKTYKHELGVRLRIARTMIDAGYATSRVMAFTSPRRARGVYAVFGRDGEGRPILREEDRRKAKQRGQGPRHYIVGVDDAKRLLYSRLRLEEPGPGYCHFPQADAYDEEHFKQLVGEKLERKKVGKSAVRYVWVKDHPRVEALDCRVYAMAGVSHFNPTWEVLEARIKGAAGKQKADASPSSIKPADLKRLRRQARRRRESL